MKLYRVLVEFEAVVMVEDSDEAEDFVDTIVETETPCVSLLEIQPQKIESTKYTLPSGWTLNTYLYHSGVEDMTVAQALEQIKSD
jgi:hypothetical protein